MTPSLVRFTLSLLLAVQLVSASIGSNNGIRPIKLFHEIAQNHPAIMETARAVDKQLDGE